MLLTSLVFGLLPALRGSRTEITLSLKDRSGALSAGGISLRRMLVGIQVALSLLLLVGAGLFVRTLRNLENLGPGFPTDRLLTFRIDASLAGYSDQETKSFYERLNVNLETVPGVASVGFSTMPLLKGYAWRNAILGKNFEGAPIEEQPVLCEVGPDYFRDAGYSHRRRACLHNPGRWAGRVQVRCHQRDVCQEILPGPKSHRAALRAGRRNGANHSGH
jgi:hypothetical protein